MSPISFKIKQIRHFIGILILSIYVSIPTSVFAQPGALDPTFGSGGIVTTDVGVADDKGYSVIQQLDGKLVVIGLSGNGTNNDFAVTRYNLDGSLDGGWGLGGIVTTPIGPGSEAGQSVIQQPDGKILVAGYASNGTNNDFALVRYHVNGNLDTGFGTGGITITPVGGIDQGQSVALQQDGKIIVAGFANNGSNNDFAVTRYDSTGVLDPTFDIDGIVLTDFAFAADVGRAVAVQTDGKIVVAGWTTNGANLDFAVARYNTNGSLDPTFDGDGRVVTVFTAADDQGYSIVIQPDGKIVVSGVSNGGLDLDFAIARYNTNGSLDNTFDGDGRVTTDFFGANDLGYSLAVQTDGKIVVAGQCVDAGNQDFGVARYNPDGSLDVTFDGDGLVNTDLPGSNNDVGWAVTIQADERVVVAGSNNLSSSSTFGVTRYLVCEIVDTSLTFIPADTSLTANASGIGFQWINCDSTFSIIPGEINQSYLINANGSFAVIITTTTYCSDTSSCFTIMNLSNENYAFENTIMVFPNPGNGPLWLATEKPLNDATINLISLTGQILMTKTNITGYKASIDISSHTNGIYILEVIDNGKVAKLKVVKQ